MVKGSIDSIESMGLVDGPGVRTVVFLTGCRLRCKFCHNPEMWIKRADNITPEELVEKLKRFKPYYEASNNGGVTFSGGEPLLQPTFVIEVCKLLKAANIHIALDTSGVGTGNYDELLKYIDLVILDIKHVIPSLYRDITGEEMTYFNQFVTSLNESNKPCYIRQVIVPGINDNMVYLNQLHAFLKGIKHIEKVEFLPYHKLGSEKYIALGINNPYIAVPAMDIDKCQELYNSFMKI
ncbi:MAG: pyruvate formate-lyase-activating protein [Bacilli bacterium]